MPTKAANTCASSRRPSSHAEAYEAICIGDSIEALPLRTRSAYRQGAIISSCAHSAPRLNAHHGALI